MPKVTIVEVGPRDGLQNEKVVVSTADKIEFINRLSARGIAGDRSRCLRQSEVGAANGRHGRRVRWITRRTGTRYTALVPNLAGLDRAAQAGITEIAIFAASTETFSRKNINQSIDESLAGYKQVCDRAIAAGMRVRGYLSTAFGCPFEGTVPTERVAASLSGSPRSACSKYRSATPSASRTRARCRVSSRRCWRACRSQNCAAFSRHPRHLARVRDADGVADRYFEHAERGDPLRDSGHSFRRDGAFERTTEGGRQISTDAHSGGDRPIAHLLITGQRLVDALIDVLAAERFGRCREDRDFSDPRLRGTIEPSEICTSAV